MTRTRAPHKLPKIAELMGEPLETLIPRIVEREGSLIAAAAALNVSTNTLRNWLTSRGLMVVTHQVAHVVPLSEV